MLFLLLTQYTRHNLDATDDGNLFKNRARYTTLESVSLYVRITLKN